MLEVLAGYQRGLGKLHRRDHEEHAWFLDRIRDLRTIVGPSTVQPLRRPDEPDWRRPLTWRKQLGAWQRP
jgi:hypothetical protein